MIDTIKNIFGIWRISGEEKGEIFIDRSHSISVKFPFVPKLKVSKESNFPIH